MKRSLTCPKCSGRELLHVTQLADRVGDMGGARMDHGEDPRPEAAQFYPTRIARVPNPDGSFWASHVLGAGLLEAIVCRACGYTELYTRDPASIPVDGTVVRLLDGGSKTPFR